MTSPRPHLRHVKINVRDQPEYKPKEPSPIPRLHHVTIDVKESPEFKPKEPSPIPRLRHVTIDVKQSPKPKPKEPSPIPHLHHVTQSSKETTRYRTHKSPVPRLRHVGNANDNSGFTPKQRHEIIMKTLKAFKKTPKTFKGHWDANSGEYLTGEILLKTPMFWFMKDKWARSEIETLFYKARVVIDRKFDSALHECFGGNPGPRWKGSKGDENKQDAKWKRGRHRFNTVALLKKTTKDYSKWTPPTDLKKVCHIDVECPNKEILNLAVELKDPLHYVKKQIAHKTNGKYAEKEQILLLRNVKITETIKTLKQYGIVDGDKLTLSMGDIGLNIERHNGIQSQISIDRFQSVVTLKSAIETQIHPHIPATEQYLIFKQDDDNKFMENDKLLMDYDLNEGDIVYLSAPTSWRVPKDQNKYIINIQRPDGHTLEMFVVNEDILSYIKLGIQTLTDSKYEVNDQILYFQENELDDDNQTLCDIGITKTDTLQLSVGFICISIETREGVIYDIDVNPHELILNIKRIIEHETDGLYSVEDQQIFRKTNDEELDNDKTLCSYGVFENDVLYVGGNIMVKLKGNDDICSDLSVDPKYYIETLKHVIFQKHDVTVEQQTLYLNDIELNDDETLISYNIKKGDIIDLKVICTVFIERKDADRIALNVTPNEQILDIKKRIYAKIKASEAKEDESDAESGLLKMNLKLLKRKCKAHRISFEGSKLDMITRLLQKEIDNLILKFKDNILGNNRSIKDYKINHNDVLMLHEVKAKVIKPVVESKKTLEKDCTLLIDLPNRKIIKITVNLEYTVMDIKKQIETDTKKKYPSGKQIIQYKKKRLTDDKLTLKMCGVKNKDTLDLSMQYITVYVEKIDGERLALKIDSYAPVVAIKYQVDKRLYPRIPIREQNLFKTKERDEISDNGYTDNDALLFYCNIHNGNTVYLGAPNRWRVPMSNDKYTINAECIDGQILPLFVVPQDIISYLKLQIEEQTDGKYGINDIKLYFKGKELKDDYKSLKQLGILRDNIIQLSIGDISISIETQEKTVIELMVNPHELISNVKNLIQNKTGGEYLLNEIHIFKKTKNTEMELKDKDKSLFNYGVFEECKLYLGGKIKIKIKGNNGLITDVAINPTETISTLKHLIHFETGTFAKQQTLCFKGFELTDHQTLNTYRIKRNDIIDLKVIYSIFVDNEDAQRRVKLDVAADEGIADLKQRLLLKMSTPVEVQRQILKFDNNILKDDGTIAQYDITQNSVIKLTSEPVLVPLDKKKHKKRKKKKKKKRKRSKKTVRDSWLFDDNELPFNTGPKMMHRRSESAGNILQKPPQKEKEKDVNPMGVDVNSLFDMTEIDDIVNNLDKYEEKLQNYDDFDDVDDVNALLEFDEEEDDDDYNWVAPRLSERERAQTLGIERISVKPNTKTKIKRESAIMREIAIDDVNDDEKTAFDNRRKMDLDDLMDGFFTDDDDDDDGNGNGDDLDDIKQEITEQFEEIEDEQMPFDDLLKMFNLNRNKKLYKYYHKTLNIEFAQDFIDHMPSRITQPLQFKSTKVRILLTRMSKYITNKIIQNEWDGDCAKEWMELETNTVSRVFSPQWTPTVVQEMPSEFMYSSNIGFEDEDDNAKNEIKIYGHKECVVDYKIELGMEYGVKVELDEIPDPDRNEKETALVIGCSFYDGFGNEYERVYITERCAIYRDPLYLNMLSLSNVQMMDTDSQIHITISNKMEEPIVKFAHFRNDKMHKYNEREIVLHQLSQPIGSYAKLFIEQNYGRGMYSIYEITKIENEMKSAMTPMVQSKNKNKKNNLSMQRRMSF